MPRKNNNRNLQQDLAITELKIEVKNLKERFDSFITNEFEHLREKVDWILWIFIVGTLVSIAINYLK